MVAAADIKKQEHTGKVKQRIKPIDGLRTVAVFGVIWIHAWMFYNNPPFSIASVDLFKLVAVAGNGVDFFFVISGFCMYLMIDKTAPSLNKYLHFLYKRFLRIAPAFYTSVVVYALILTFSDAAFRFWYNVSFHLFFLNNILGNTISGPFWSIGVEWHFYLLLPLIIVLARRLSLVMAVLLLSVACIAFYCFAIAGNLDAAWWENQIVVRFPEFAWGILAAHFFLNNRTIPAALSRNAGLLAGFVVLYSGRIMMYTPLLVKAGSLGFY